MHRENPRGQHELQHDRGSDQETLKDVKPEVMRRFVVPFGLRLDRLHLTLQAAFDWADSRLFEFIAGNGHWGISDLYDGFDPQPIDARKTRLCNIVRDTGAKTIHYLYDFGGRWDNVIKLEKWFGNTSTEGLPFWLDATGRCSSEDVGGVPDYRNTSKPSAIQTHPEH